MLSLFLIFLVFNNKKTFMGTVVFCMVFFFFFLKFSFYELSWGFILDKVAYMMVLLTMWLFLLLGVFKSKYFYFINSYFLSVIFLFILLLLSFSLSGMLGFYVFFELSLIPLFYILLGWGYQVERVQAAFYLFMYTIVGSFPLLLFLVIFWDKSLWCCFIFKGTEEPLLLFSSYLGVMVLFSFFVKLPAYWFHLWLPKAHVEAPFSGSMVLAAIMLKMSFFGCFRLMFIIKQVVFSMVSWLCFWMFLGAFWAAMIAFCQSDMKSLIAFSSVSHMGVMMGGFFSLMLGALKGSFIIVLVHGFCSSALFFLVNCTFEQNHSRQILLAGGYSSFFFNLSVWWFFFFVINFSAPPFLSLFGEILIIFQIVFMSLFLSFFLLCSSGVVAFFCIYAYSSISHGQNLKQNSTMGLSDVCFLSLIYHFVPCFVLIFAGQMLFF